MNKDGLEPRSCRKSTFGYLCLKNFFHNCLITNDLEGDEGYATPQFTEYKKSRRKISYAQ